MASDKRLPAGVPEENEYHSFTGRFANYAVAWRGIYAVILE